MTPSSPPPPLEQLYDAHARRLLRLATLLLGDPGRAEDALQDVFVALHRRPDHHLADPAAYLTRAVVNRCRSLGRHLTLVRRHDTSATTGSPPGPGADADLLVRERRQAVLDALATLPRRQHEVVTLRYYLDLSEREIADALGISPGAVKSHASRATAALRDRLDPHLQETP